MTLTKDSIVEIFKAKTQLSSGEVKHLIESILEIIKSRLEQGEEVKISGFGKWIVKEKRSRPGRNPHTGQRIQITERKVVTFHPSEKLRDLVDKAKLDDSKISYASKEDEED